MTEYFQQRSTARKWMTGVLAVAAVFSLALGLRNALYMSVDFLWDHIVLFLSGVDPYREYLTNPAYAKSIVGHEPNSGHLTFLLMAPYGLLGRDAARIAWGITNICFAVASLYLLRSRMPTRTTATLSLLFLCAYPTRMSIEFGQTSLMCLFFYSLSIWAADRKHNAASLLLAGFGLLKYSFGVPLFFARDFRRWKELPLYAVPAAAAIVFWAALFHYDLIQTAVLPLQVVARQISGQLTGQGDLQTVLSVLAVPRGLIFRIVLGALAVLTFVQKKWMPTSDDLESLGYYSLIALLLFYHRVYDFVFLLPAVICATHMSNLTRRYVVYAIVAYFWFILTPLKMFVLHDWEPLFFNDLCLWVLVGIFLFEARQTIKRSNASLSQSKSEAEPESEPLGI